MRVRVALAAAGAMLAAGGTAAAPPALASASSPTRGSAGPAATGAYLTIVAGRMEWAGAVQCQPLAGSDTLTTVAQHLQQLSPRLTVYGTIVGDRTNSGTTRNCTNNVIYPTWNDLATLHSGYGWTFGSNGLHHNAMTQPGQTPAQLWSTSCGALRDPTSGLITHGYTTAWSLFAYPFGGDYGADLTNALQDQYVSRCYTFGREYDNTPPYAINTRTSVAGNHWFAQTHNIYGGTCNAPDQTAPCHSVVSSGGHVYDNPADLTALVQPGAGQWSILQFHLVVEGSRLTGSGPTWDCTNADWHYHWATDNEMYCWNDLASVLGAVPSSVQVVDPSVVATAWGRTMPAPTLSRLTPSSGGVAGGVQVTLTGTAFRAVGTASNGWAGGNGFQVNFGSRRAKVLRVSATSVVVTAPPAAAPGTVSVTVWDADRQSVTLASAFRYGP